MSIFKGYDIRGIYPSQLNQETAYKIGRAFVSFVKPKNVVIGQDVRLSSPKLFESLSQGIMDQGADVIHIGLSTTPMMYFSTIKLGADAGINITASHNPKEYNGFKLVRRQAVPISSETGIYEIQELVEKNKFSKPKKKGKLMKQEMLNQYINNALSFVDVEKIKYLKICVDTANAMGGLIIPKLFGKLPCELVPLFMDMDGTFPNHEPNPLKEETLEELKKSVVKEKADLGIGLDGDADRIIFVDEKAQVIPGDIMTALLSKMILSKHPKTPKAKILYDLRSSWVVKEEIEKHGGKAIEFRVGHSFIKEKMRTESIEFAGEVSGHYYLKQNHYIESPMIIILYLLEFLSKEKEKKNLSEIIEPLKKYFPSGEINFKVKNKEATMKKVEKEFKDAKRISHMDGLKVEYKDFWFNLRPSNTEPLIRLNIEAKTKPKMEEMRSEISLMIQE